MTPSAADTPWKDWAAEIDAWTERFREVSDPPEPFATAIHEGWTTAARTQLALDAQAYMERQQAYVETLRREGMDLVRLDVKSGCEYCMKYDGSAYSLAGETPGLPPPPPLPICPACRPVLNLLTPFFMQQSGLTLEDLVERSVPFVPFDE